MNEIASALHTLLAYNIVSFTYRKVNGEIRHAKGTRNLDLARNTTGEYIPNPKGAEQPNSYYDVQSNGWRSYKPENLVSIDGVYAREDTDFAKKPELPKREIPVVKPTDGGDLRKPDIGAILGGLFGGFGIPKDEIRKSMDKLDKDIVIGAPAHSPKVGTPTATERGIALPLGEIGVEDFAKMVAHYVVDELITRLTR
jgi:hypothetical protein